MGRKIAIMGAGAVGGYAGAHMVQAGEDVTFIDPWPEHVEHMRKHGLRVTHARDVEEFDLGSPAFLHILAHGGTLLGGGALAVLEALLVAGGHRRLVALARARDGLGREV